MRQNVLKGRKCSNGHIQSKTNNFPEYDCECVHSRTDTRGKGKTDGSNKKSGCKFIERKINK